MNGCTHIDKYGLRCNAEGAFPCVAIDKGGTWRPIATPHPERQGLFTPTETRIVELLTEGHNRESITNQLGIAPSTTSRHLSNLYEKLGVNSMQEVVVWWFRANWEPRVVG